MPLSSYTPDGAYLLSDFAVAPTDYPRMSKLIVLAATSAETQLLCQRAFSRRIRAASTTAFSNNPVSMKYRGLLRLTKRGPPNENDWKFQLQYQGAMGGHTRRRAADVDGTVGRSHELKHRDGSLAMLGADAAGRAADGTERSAHPDAAGRERPVPAARAVPAARGEHTPRRVLDLDAAGVERP
ncbi:hypothetical protein [Streptomyces sp. NPDC050659]